MTVTANFWRRINNLGPDQIKASAFSLLQEVAQKIVDGTQDDPFVLESVPRLAELITLRPELSSFKAPLNSLARASGLWNYIEKETADTQDAIVAEAATSEELGGVTLHREQIAALNELLQGRNLILSAPTSFGKSLLIDALIASRKYQRVAIVLPTIALLDEFRRRLRRRFRDEFTVVMHPTDKSEEGQPTIFLGTQERLIARTDIGQLDLTVVDEFYKLDPARKDERSVTLNAAVYKLLNRSRQFFFLGPNIDGVHVSGDGRWKFEFLRTRFSTVAVDTYDLKDVEDKQGRLFKEIATDENWPALVFVSSPDKANKLMGSAASEITVSDDGSEFADWLRSNVGKSWPIVNGVNDGFAIHHGRIPRAIASHMIRLFNRRSLPVMFCTSTLIEGVNTAAKTVLIYDKKISRSNYDFFTFSNIKGRAGRLGEHHVGKVYLFNAPPNAQETEIHPTLFGDEDDAPDDYVVHLDEFDSTHRTDERIGVLTRALNLSADELKLAASIGLDDAMRLKDLVFAEIMRGGGIAWSGYPTYHEISATMELICQVKRPNSFGAFSTKQLCYFITRLRSANTIREFLLEYDEGFRGDPVSHDNIFKFLRSCEYGLPQVLSIVELFTKKHKPKADYSLFIQGLSHWFRAEVLKYLDEEGVPIQISERFIKSGDSRETLLMRLTAAAQGTEKKLSAFEKRWISDALELDH